MLVALCACAALATNAAHADDGTIYEWRDAHGVKSFSQLPPPAGTPDVTSQQIQTQTLTPAERAAVKARLLGADANARAKAEAYQRQLDAADQAVNRALQALALAEQAARQGRTPQPGERVGIVGGHTRLRTDYFDRQSLLEQAVEQARARLNEAYRQRDDLMQ
jgi:hypothetical protein